MKTDNLLILVAVSARGPGILHDKMHVISEGEIDSPFSQRNQRAYCVSICEVQILMQHRSRFFIFPTRI